MAISDWGFWAVDRHGRLLDKEVGSPDDCDFVSAGGAKVSIWKDSMKVSFRGVDVHVDGAVGVGDVFAYSQPGMPDPVEDGRVRTCDTLAEIDPVTFFVARALDGDGIVGCSWLLYRFMEDAPFPRARMERVVRRWMSWATDGDRLGDDDRRCALADAEPLLRVALDSILSGKDHDQDA